MELFQFQQSVQPPALQQSNTNPALVADMQEALEKLWPEEMHTRHGSTWGDDNGFSHLRASFLGPSITVPLQNGKLILGTWQQIIAIDHDNSPRNRKIFVQIVGN